MKVITMFSRKEYLVDDTEADTVSQLFNSNALVELKCGAKINPKGIESIGDSSDTPFIDWKSYDESAPRIRRLYKSNTGEFYFINDNRRKIFLADLDLPQIKYIKTENKQLTAANNF